jgi:TonB family protein
MRTTPLVLVTSGILAVTLMAGAAQEAAIVYKPGGAVSPPRVVREVKPQYTADAMKAQVQGKVEVECVVLPDGTVGDVIVVTPLHPSLDQAAIKAVKQWQFKPGMKDGEPVAVRVSIELSFTLRDRKGKPSLPLPSGSEDKTPASAPATTSTLVFKPGDGVSPPRVVHEVRPTYTLAAKEAKTQGTVLLECVVDEKGAVGDVRVSRSLDPGLDLEAIKAVRQWRFEPGTKDGKPVPVQISVELTFTLR